MTETKHNGTQLRVQLPQHIEAGNNGGVKSRLEKKSQEIQAHTVCHLKVVASGCLSGEEMPPGE